MGNEGKSPHDVLVSELLAAFFLRSLVAGMKLGSVNAILNKWLVCDWPFLAPPQTPALDAGTSKRSPMTQLETSKPNQTSSRRALLKTAAWATPVIAVAVAAPLAAASINDAAVYLEGTISPATGSRNRIDGTSGSAFSTLAGSSILRISNGNGAVPGPITGTITVTYVSNTLSGFGFGDAVVRGFGPSLIQNATLTSYSSTTQDIGNTLGGDLFARNVTRNFSIAGTIAGNSNVSRTITWGYTPASGIAIGSGTVTFLVTVRLFSNGVEFDATTSNLVYTV